MNRFSLLIPNFNHKETIASLLDRLAVHQLPCLIVNDGSDAETRGVLEQQESVRDWVKVLHLPKQRGKGGAVLAGLFHLHEAGYTHAVQLDADGQHDPDDVPKFLQQAEAHPSALILGRPVYNPDAPKSRIIGRQISRCWVWIETLSFDIADPMLGYRVYPIGATVAVARRHRLGTRMDFDPEIAVRLYWEGTSVRNIQTRIEYPKGGRSHFLMFKDNTLISWLHTRLFFGMLIRLPRLLAKGGT
jgi:glycosyltransferase involved in cell wall biosynthesis